MGHIAFGYRVFGFSTIFYSEMHCFQIIFGNWDKKSLMQADAIIASFYLITFLLIITIILLNVFIAILEFSYKNVKSRQDLHIQKQGRLKSVIACCKNLYRRLRFRKNIRSDKVIIVKPPDPETFCWELNADLKNGLMEKEANVFASLNSEQILKEHRKRADYKKYPHGVFHDKLARGIIVSKDSFQNDQDVIDSLIYFWDYFRLVNPIIKRHKEEVRKDTERIVDQLH